MNEDSDPGIVYMSPTSGSEHSVDIFCRSSAVSNAVNPYLKQQSHSPTVPNSSPSAYERQRSRTSPTSRPKQIGWSSQIQTNHQPSRQPYTAVNDQQSRGPVNQQVRVLPSQHAHVPPPMPIPRPQSHRPPPLQNNQVRIAPPINNRPLPSSNDHRNTTSTPQSTQQLVSCYIVM